MSIQLNLWLLFQGTEVGWCVTLYFWNKFVLMRGANTFPVRCLRCLCWMPDHCETLPQVFEMGFETLSSLMCMDTSFFIAALQKSNILCDFLFLPLGEEALQTEVWGKERESHSGHSGSGIKAHRILDTTFEGPSLTFRYLILPWFESGTHLLLDWQRDFSSCRMAQPGSEPATAQWIEILFLR